MDGMTEKGTNIVDARDQGPETMIDMHASDQALARERTIHIDLADPTLEIDHLDMMVDIHLDMMIDIAQDQDHEREDLHHPVIETTGVTTANLHRIYLPSHLNGIKTFHRQ
jgi:hypothetical protein